MNAFNRKHHKILIALLILIFIIRETSSEFVNVSTPELSQVKNIFNLMSQWKDKIQICRCDEITLVLGNTGSGKSTFIQWFMGNDDQMTSKEIRRGEFIIEDSGNRIGSSTLDSMTIFPELVVDSSTNMAYYDCPGFSDTRNATHEIAITYFIKKVSEQAQKIKIIFIVSYPSVKTGVDRNDFMKLLRHNIEFLKDIDKFSSSIALVVTKVDNDQVKIGRGKNARYELVSDDDIINGIAGFLNEIKRECEIKLNTTSRNRNTEFYKKTIKILNIFLFKNNEKYPKIGIFRRPDESGALNEISLLVESRSKIKNLVMQLEFTRKNNEDFGYTISDRSKNSITGLVDEINENVLADVRILGKKIETKLNEICVELKIEIDSLLSTTNVVFTEETVAEILSENLNDANKMLSELVDTIKSSKSIIAMGEKINSSCTSLEINGSKKRISNILLNGEYMEFLRIVVGTELIIRSSEWANVFQETATSITEHGEEIIDLVSGAAARMNNEIKLEIKEIIKEISRNYEVRKYSHGIQNLLSELVQRYDVIKDLRIQNSDTQNEMEIVKKILMIAKMMNMDVSKINDNALSILEKRKRLNFLQILTKRQLVSNGIENWKALLILTEEYFLNSINWYTFLRNMYAQLSNYDTQLHKNKFISINTVSSNNFNHFLAEAEQYDIEGLNAVRDVELTEIRLMDLNEAVRITIKNGINPSCSDNKLIIKAEFIKFSDFISTNDVLRFNCDSVITSITIFALNTVFIDRDFLAVGKNLQLTIIAPKWEIIGTRKIVLDGKSSEHSKKEKAQSGVKAGDNGLNGDPGSPGGSAGSFIGIGEHFFNVGNLKISANGGNGGPGQDGGDGRDGKQGENVNCPNSKARVENERYMIAVMYNQFTGAENVYGTPGGRGGNGGNGGKGGVGGKSGHIKIFYISNEPIKTKIITFTDTGNDGDPGSGGNSGKGGRNGDHYTCFYRKIITPVYWELESWLQRVETISSGTFAKNGNIGGIDDASPLPSEASVDIQDPIQLIIEFKNYLIANSMNIFEKNSLTQFLTLLNNDTNIKMKYKTFWLVEEFKNLEKQTQNDTFNVQTILFYQSLSDRILEYSERFNHNETSDLYKKILGMLYTATLSKMDNLKPNSEPTLILDIEKYLSYVIDKINKLKTLQANSKLVEVINGFKSKYKSEIDKKIDEASVFVNIQIASELTIINEQIDNKISQLIDEIIGSRKKVEKNKHELKQQRSELAKTLKLRTFTRGLNILSQVLSCLGPWGKAAGTVIEMAKVSVELQNQKIENAFDSAKALDVATAAIKVKDVIAVMLDENNKHKSDEASLNAFDDAIQEAGSKIEYLVKHENYIYKEMIPMVQGMADELNNLSHELNGSSQAALDIANWQIQDALRDMKLNIKHFTHGYKVEGILASCIEKFEEAITTLIKVYDRLQNYQDQQNLANYIADVNSAADLSIITIDPKLGIAVNDLDISIKTNIILKQYKTAIDSFKQWVFPFAHLYIKEIELPSHLELEKNIQNLLSKAVTNINAMNAKIKSYKISIQNQDQYKFCEDFSSSYVSSKPFFVWENYVFKKAISELLSGKTVALKADVMKSAYDKDAIKFLLIGIAFNFENKTRQFEMEEKLKGFKLSATHMGNSYYRYDEKFYVITTESLNIQYTFEKNAQNEPVSENVAYSKIKAGDLMLSPYGMWEIQLIKSSNASSFNDLSTFKHEVDLELTGRGCYVATDHEITDLYIDNYYERYYV